MIASVKKYLNERNVKLIAVSKTKSVDDILTIYKLGQRDFGENRVKELNEKRAHLPSDILWHMIGHLQKNKVKYIAPYVHMIQSVDSLDLATTINKEALKNKRIINILLQIKIASEDSKSGIDAAELESNIQSFKDLPNLNISGLMGMGTLTNDNAITKNEFNKLKKSFDLLKTNHFINDDAFKEISMGMSGDYKIAIECGSTMVRIGSLIFGSRS